MDVLAGDDLPEEDAAITVPSRSECHLIAFADDTSLFVGSALTTDTVTSGGSYGDPACPNSWRGLVEGNVDGSLLVEWSGPPLTPAQCARATIRLRIYETSPPTPPFVLPTVRTILDTTARGAVLGQECFEPTAGGPVLDLNGPRKSYHFAVTATRGYENGAPTAPVTVKLLGGA